MTAAHAEALANTCNRYNLNKTDVFKSYAKFYEHSLKTLQSGSRSDSVALYEKHANNVLQKIDG